ncbi:hypothetical protein [Moorena sp. SIO4G3]|nr:hypothetical protein [Moorena sp. SIO4G3]NEO79533.1 hypothetical protein [Moorena sp. SIO4G3]
MLSSFKVLLLLDAIKDAIAFSLLPTPYSLLPIIPKNHCVQTTQNPQRL